MANRLTQPEDITHAAWATVNAAPVADTVVAPDGTLTGDTLIDVGTGSPASVRVQQNPANLVASSPYHVAAFFQPLGLDWVLISLAGYSPLSLFAYYDTRNKVFGTLGADIDGVGIEYDEDGGWSRPYISFTPDVDVAGVLRIYPATGDNVVTVDLDGTSSVYTWGITIDDGAVPPPYRSEAGIVVGARGLPQRRPNIIQQLRHH